MIINVRSQIVKWAVDGITQRQHFTYEEVRPLPLTWPPHHTNTDCSFFVKLCYWKAGAKDPTGLNYDGYGNSDSLFARGKHIALGQLKPGDVIVFGPGGSVHAVVVVSVADKANPVCVSMGKPGDPSLASLGECLYLGTPTFLRFNTINRHLIPSPKRH